MSEHQLLLKIEELQRQLKALAEENAALRYERDVARADLWALVPAATPEQEAEFREQLERGEWLDFSAAVESLTADLRGARAPH